MAQPPRLCVFREMRTIATALGQTERVLEAAGVEDARLEAEVLVMEAASLTRPQLYTRWTEALTPEADSKLEAMRSRRARGEPLAYITGHRAFYGRAFHITPAVLIPRPETELLVEAALAWWRALSPLVGESRREGASDAHQGGGPQPARAEPGVYPEPGLHPTRAELVEVRASARINGASLTAADIGTGSGIIAITLAAECPDLKLQATDQSQQALDVATQNAQTHEVANRITFAQGDLVEPLQGKMDLIAANLPYVRDDQLPQWCGAAQVELSFEPYEALSGGADGLAVIRRFLVQAPDYLNPGGVILMEIAYDQGTAVRSLARQSFPESRITVKKDLAGLDRLVIIQTEAPLPEPVEGRG